MQSPLWPLLRSFSWQEFRQHPWRNATAVMAVALGVALALAIHLINASALDEFAQAARSVGGQPDLELRPLALDTATVPEALWARLANHPDVAIASPVLEINTYALLSPTSPASPTNTATDPTQPGNRLALKVLGIDTLGVALLAPQWLPRPAQGEDRMASFAPGKVFLNPAAQAQLGSTRVDLQQGLQVQRVEVAGTVSAGGKALAVMDIGAAQDLFGKPGVLSRIDLRLRAGVDRDRFIKETMAQADWPAGTRFAKPGEATDRLGALSRAYRVNLTVLALVALFTGEFLVFSVLALSVSRRAPQWALLGVLGLTSAQRQQLVLLEAGVLGLVGSSLGVALGTALAAAALYFLGGDLGGGYFAGVAPALHWSPVAALVFGALGVAAALLGAWQPARWAQGISAAQALKGLGGLGPQDRHAWHSAALLAAGGLLALLPPIWDIPLAAYASVAALLMGGIAALPWLVGQVLQRLAPRLQRSVLPLLAIERARRARASASVAVSGVVAALSLAVALTVMVASFRGSVSQWLDQVLPADLYVRTANSGAAQDTAYFDPAFVQAAARLPGVARVGTQRSQSLLLQPTLPPVALVSRSVTDLPLVGQALPVPAGHIGVYVSEAMVDLHGARPGSTFSALSEAFRPVAQVKTAQAATFFVAGVWRDYARQFGAIAMSTADFEQLTGDHRVNDIALWLQEGTSPEVVEQALRTLANHPEAWEAKRFAQVKEEPAQRAGDTEQNALPPKLSSPTQAGNAGQLLEFASAQSIRAISLRIFDRSFAVTYWLQAVAIGIGLFGVAASFSAQVLARRKEYGLLVHLGLTRTQVLRVVALEGAAWTTLGAAAGLALGMAVAVVLVKVVNPQSFHWTMDLNLPTARLLALGAAVVLAGTLTAWLSARAAAGRDAVLAVKEDW
jgi:putative ABC transport system permease protein